MSPFPSGWTRASTHQLIGRTQLRKISTTQSLSTSTVLVQSKFEVPLYKWGQQIQYYFNTSVLGKHVIHLSTFSSACAGSFFIRRVFMDKWQGGLGSDIYLSSPSEAIDTPPLGRRSSKCQGCCQRSELFAALSVVCVADFLGILPLTQCSPYRVCHLSSWISFLAVLAGQTKCWALGCGPYICFYDSHHVYHFSIDWTQDSLIWTQGTDFWYSFLICLRKRLLLGYL